jgi:hypothetical protein
MRIEHGCIQLEHIAAYTLGAVEYLKTDGIRIRYGFET